MEGLADAVTRLRAVVSLLRVANDLVDHLALEVGLGVGTHDEEFSGLGDHHVVLFALHIINSHITSASATI